MIFAVVLAAAPRAGALHFLLAAARGGRPHDASVQGFEIAAVWAATNGSLDAG